MDILIAIIGGGVGAAVVSVIGSLILAKQNRKYQKEDKESADMTALKAGMKWLMYDRIRFLGLRLKFRAAGAYAACLAAGSGKWRGAAMVMV